MRRILFFVWVGLWCIVSPWQVALADSPLKSNTYEVDESFIGGGGLITEGSTNYQANESIGDVGIGNSSSTSFQTNSGYTTTSDPALTFIVSSSVINFGTITSSTTATANATFTVINYTSYGYNVLVIGTPPKTGNKTLAGMSSTAPSTTGTEQFGMNVRANTQPISFGADPSGGLGTFGAGYGTVNQYKYNNGDTIATAVKDSAQTNYTLSYIINASATTAGGVYTGSQSLICVGTY